MSYVHDTYACLVHIESPTTRTIVLEISKASKNFYHVLQFRLYSLCLSSNALQQFSDTLGRSPPAVPVDKNMEVARLQQIPEPY